MPHDEENVVSVDAESGGGQRQSRFPEIFHRHSVERFFKAAVGEKRVKSVGVRAFFRRYVKLNRQALFGCRFAKQDYLSVFVRVIV